MLAARGRCWPSARGLPEEKDGDRLDLSRMASDQLKPSPPTEVPGLPGSLEVSRSACAPKLTRLAKEGDAGGWSVARAGSSSSITAGSSPKLFLNSGELEAEEVATLARRWLWNAAMGEVWEPALVLNPRAVIEVPRRCCCVAPGVVGTAVDGGEEER